MLGRFLSYTTTDSRLCNTGRRRLSYTSNQLQRSESAQPMADLVYAGTLLSYVPRHFFASGSGMLLRKIGYNEGQKLRC